MRYLYSAFILLFFTIFFLDCSDQKTEKNAQQPETGLEIGKQAPNFTLTDQNGNAHTLSDYLGKNVALYFYPKDDTPGCTKEACSFRDDFSTFKNLNTVHRIICHNFSFAFLLFFDPGPVRMMGWVMKGFWMGH